MTDMLNAFLGKVFVHPVTKEHYGPIRLPDSLKFSTLDDAQFDALAADSGGNYFTAAGDGAVLFWEHETDNLVNLASSISEFGSHCIVPPPVELSPGQVKSVWIDPKFAKSLGKKVPKDGWLKRPSQPK